MKAAFLYGKKDIRIEEVAVPEIKPHEVLVQIKAVGICGSDVHYYEHFGMGPAYQLTKPQVLGHEASGIVVKVGSEVKNLKPSDRVTIEPGETCFRCEQCKNGHYNLCPDVHFLSTPDNKGAFAEYLVMNSDLLYRIPDEMSFEVASLAEPLSVGIHACEQVNARPGKSLVILGAGPIGMVTLAAARAFGLTDITMCDIQESRLSFALRYGAKHVFVNKGINAEEVVQRFTDGAGFDCCIETAGSPVTHEMSISLMKKGGIIALVGIPAQSHVSINVSDIIDKELTVRGVFRYANSYKTAVQMLNSGVIDFKSLITKRFPLKETQAALQFALEEKNHSMKTIIYVDDSEEKR